MPAEPGSEFSLWDGDICGRNLEFIPDRKVVQEWYFETSLRDPLYNFNSAIQGRFSSHCRAHNIPDEDFENIAEGWREYYMGAIIRFFNPNF